MMRLSGGRRTRPSPPSRSACGQIEGSSDAELARKLRDADEVALSELYRRFGQPCYSLARRICADDGLAEEVVYDVFQTLWRDPWRFDPARVCFATWLLTLVHQKAVDAVRSRSTVRLCSTAAAEAAEAPIADADPAAKARVAAGQVHAALDQLPGEQREVLAAAYFGGLTVREIAACTSAPLDTVKSHMFAGVQRLRSLLTDQLGPDALVTEVRTVWEMSR